MWTNSSLKEAYEKAFLEANKQLQIKIQDLTVICFEIEEKLTSIVWSPAGGEHHICHLL